MYTKKILSMAATIALVSTASLAFETNTFGEITAGSTPTSTYTGGTPVPADADLNLSNGLYGDALIYPYFKATDGWTTEIILRNTTPHATVAKVSVYEKTKSADIGDFNVYLSPYDVLRFTIVDGIVKTADGSVPTQVRNPKHGPKADTATWLDLDGNSEELEILKLKAENSNQLEGYVVVYGMTQYHDGDTHASSSYGQNTVDLNYHQKHNELFQDYRRLMDDCRANWRTAFNRNGMKEGVMISRVVGGIPAPDTNIGSECATKSASVLYYVDKEDSSNNRDYQLENFGDVDTNTFTGTVRVFKEDGQQSRDLLLPATAISNFSVDNMYLWAEGEFAGLEDRRMVRVDGKVKPITDTRKKEIPYVEYYDKDVVLQDSDTFMTKTALYTFDSKEGAAVANQILVTQPTKRTLGALFGTPGDSSTGYYWLEDGTQYGGFQLEYFLLDEDEGADVAEVGFTRITSPAGNLGEIPTWQDEMQKITSADLEDLAAIEEFKNNDGYSFLNFIGAQLDADNAHAGIPAIVTEMTATKVGGIAQTNWIYAPTTK